MGTLTDSWSSEPHGTAVLETDIGCGEGQSRITELLACGIRC